MQTNTFNSTESQKLETEAPEELYNYAQEYMKQVVQASKAAGKTDCRRLLLIMMGDKAWQVSDVLHEMHDSLLDLVAVLGTKEMTKLFKEHFTGYNHEHLTTSIANILRMLHWAKNSCIEEELELVELEDGTYKTETRLRRLLSNYGKAI